MSDCLFCKIVKGEIPAAKVYEDEKVLAFLDINPINPGHTLLVPKEHSENMDEASGEVLRDLVSLAPEIARKIMKSLDYKGYNFITNNGGVAGQEVKHLHFHIIPRKKDDQAVTATRSGYAEGEISEVAEKITKCC